MYLLIPDPRSEKCEKKIDGELFFGASFSNYTGRKLAVKRWVDYLNIFPIESAIKKFYYDTYFAVWEFLWGKAFF